MFKKFMVIVLASTLLLNGTTVSADQGDKPSSWAKASVQEAIKLGFVPERLQSKYQSPITREEFAELIVKTMFTAEKDNAVMGGTTYYWTEQTLLESVELDFEFEDAKQDHVKLAYILGSINGVTDTLFAPDRLITRQEAATMLMNTNHLGNGFRYRPKEELNYSDFDQIAPWAKPAVQAAASVDYMTGVGGKFDYAGKFTREQSIMTMLKLYNSFDDIYLRGNMGIVPGYHELTYRISKNAIKVSYHDDDTYTRLEEASRIMWESMGITDGKTFDLESAIVLFALAGATLPYRHPEVVSAAIEHRQSKWDYGWAKVSIFNDDHLLRIEFDPAPGYLTLIAGIRYGYPLRPVTVKEIKD